MRKETTGNLGTFIRPKRSALRPQRNLERRTARRMVLPGYPIAPRPFTRDEINAYLSGDRVTCMLCGKAYKKIGIHLKTIHSVEVDEYRAMYGLPWRTGLTGEETREKHSVIAKRMLAEHDHLLPYRHLLGTGTARAKQPYLREEQTARILAGAGREARYEAGTFDEFLRRMATGRTRNDVCNDEDMPGTSWLYQQMKDDPALKTRYRETVEALPYPVQAKMTSLGQRFMADVRRLRSPAEGRLSDEKIAQALGVTAMPVNKMRRKHGIA